MLLLRRRLKAVLSRCEDVAKTPKYERHLSMDCRERGSHARGVYPTQDTSRMGTARVKQEEEADITNAKDLTIELPKGR